jgi:hypothetical protein
MTRTRKTTLEKVRDHRARLRAQGLRPLQIWVPDTRSPGFATEARRQSLLVVDDPVEAETLDWIDRAADRRGWQ